jgi:hypothetical protein
MRQFLLIIAMFACMNVVGQNNKLAGMSPFQRWLQILEDRQVKQDSTIKSLKTRIDSISRTVEYQSAEIKSKHETTPLQKTSSPWYTQNLTRTLFIIAGSLLLILLVLVILLPILMYRELNKLKEEVDTRFDALNIETEKIRVTNIPEKEVSEKKPMGVKDQLDELLTLDDKETFVRTHISLMELSIITLRESESNQAYAALNKLPVSKEFTGVVRFLHRVSACVFRGRMPALEPVISEILHHFNDYSGEIEWNINPIKEWLNTAKELSSDQIRYLNQLVASVEKIISIHNSELK